MSSHPGAASYDTALLDEPDVDLSRDIRRQVLEKFDILDTADHYELLGVSRDAEKKFIKRAYYDLVIIYHPDKYFGKKLGSFAPKIGKVFERMTKAYETLTRKRTRAEYDAYLGGRERTAQLDSSRTNLQRQRDELERVQRELEREARAQASSRPSMSSVQVRRPPDPAARRAALRRRLGGRGSEPAPTTTDPAPPPPSPEQVLDAASDDLKRRYEQRLSKMRQDRVGRYQRVAQEALESDDPVSAANALRIAASLAPNNTEIAATLEATSKRADKVVAESYSEQARYEERNGNLLEAANSYGRAARAAHDNPRLFYKAASLLVRSEGDSKTAVEMAKSAVSLAPDRIEHRLVLARAFAMAGMMKSALAEVDRVLESHKGNDEAKQLLRELRRS